MASASFEVGARYTHFAPRSRVASAAPSSDTARARVVLYVFVRVSEEAVEVGRLIERSLRDSRAIDTEALCIRAGEKVWAVQIDVHVLDDGGNLIDAASIATVSALLHFRRPDVSITGDAITVVRTSPRARFLFELTTCSRSPSKCGHFTHPLLSVYSIPLRTGSQSPSAFTICPSASPLPSLVMGSYLLRAGHYFLWCWRLTSCVGNGSDQVVVDPWFKEEQSLNGRVTLIHNQVRFLPATPHHRQAPTCYRSHSRVINLLFPGVERVAHYSTGSCAVYTSRADPACRSIRSSSAQRSLPSR